MHYQMVSRVYDLEARFFEAPERQSFNAIITAVAPSSLVRAWIGGLIRLGARAMAAGHALDLIETVAEDERGHVKNQRSRSGGLAIFRQRGEQTVSSYLVAASPDSYFFSTIKNRSVASPMFVTSCQGSEARSRTDSRQSEPR